MAPTPQVIRRQPVAVKMFLDAVDQAAPQTKLTADAAQSLMSQNSIVVPDAVQALVAKYDSAVHPLILDGIRDGIREYEKQHGFRPDDTFIETVLDNALKTVTPLADLDVPVRLDSATNAHHDQLSLQPAMAIVSIMAMFAEAIPFAAYLPADVKSNEARLAIMDNKADSAFGDYAAGDSLNGIAGGGAYLDCERVCLLTANGGAGPFAFAVKARTNDTGAAAPLLRGRTILLCNGLPVGGELQTTSGSGNNAVAGSVTLGGTTFTLGGTVNTDTGAMSITTSTALPAGTVLEALAYIDFERAPQLAPYITTEATIYKLFARASRGLVKVSIDASSQMQQELSLDPRGQSLLALRSQRAQERHYRALAKMLRIGLARAAQWNYDYSTQIAEKDRAQLWLNLMPVLAAESQKMAERTVDHGITTLYFTGALAAELRGLPSVIFESSGITDRPGIYRLGRLFGLYDCYYLPTGKGLTDSSSASQILAIGRATNVARNPIVLGDAVPGLFLPLAMNSDMNTNDGYYERSFTEINPHTPSADAAVLINVINRG
jgi:hypothetical protein